MCLQDGILAEEVEILRQAILNGTVLEIVNGFNVIAFMRNNALNAAINHFSTLCLNRGLRVTKPCENKVKVEEVI